VAVESNLSPQLLSVDSTHLLAGQEENLRRVTNKRPRAQRRRVGREFQLDQRSIRTLTRYQHQWGCPDASSALRHLLRRFEARV
jgi:hypothetical protein